MKKKSFTLAEVLITLTIIGVITAITIPTLSKSLQNAQLKTQFKKSYSMLWQAYNKTVYDLGGDTGCYNIEAQQITGANGKNCQQFWPEFLDKLKVVKTCSPRGAGGNGCIPYGIDYSNCGYYNAYYLADGQIFIPARSYGFFMFDINGVKGPNKRGYDVFGARIRKTSSGKIEFRQSYFNGNCMGTPAKGGLWLEDMVKKTFINK